MMKSKKFRSLVENVIVYSLIAVAVVLSLFPILWLFQMSIKDPNQTFAIPPVWFFEPTLKNYQDVFVYGPFPRYFLNSMIIAGVSTGASLFIALFAAYAFARFRFRGASLTQLLVLIPQMLPPITIIVPLFILFKTFDLIDTHLSLIIAYMTFNIPISVWMLSGFFRDIPQELEEAAMIDGCTRLGSLWRVVLPLAAPGIAATAILCFMYSWNEFLYAVILTGRSAKTVPVAITGFITNKAILWGRIAAAGSVVLVPVLIFALSVQRYLVRGLSKGAIKG